MTLFLRGSSISRKNFWISLEQYSTMMPLLALERKRLPRTFLRCSIQLKMRWITCCLIFSMCRFKRAIILSLVKLMMELTHKLSRTIISPHIMEATLLLLWQPILLTNPVKSSYSWRSRIKISPLSNSTCKVTSISQILTMLNLNYSLIVKENEIKIMFKSRVNLKHLITIMCM